MTPLSRWGNAYTPVDDRNVWEPYPASDPLGEWKTMNRAMTEDPPVGEQTVLMKAFSGIGIGPGMDVGQWMPPPSAAWLAQHCRGRLLKASIEVFYDGTRVNNWNFTSKPTVVPASRAVPESGWATVPGGIIGNENEEAMYMPAYHDVNGVSSTATRVPNSLQASNFRRSTSSVTDHVRHRLQPGRESINRFSLGDRSALQYDTDGGLTTCRASRRGRTGKQLVTRTQGTPFTW